MRVFQVWPKRIKRGNGQILTPDMLVTVTTKCHAQTPFANGAVEVREAYMRLYRCDIKRLSVCPQDFNIKPLG